MPAPPAPDIDPLALEQQVCFALAVTNRAVLRMTLAEPYPDGIDQPPAGEFSAGPFRI